MTNVSYLEDCGAKPILARCLTVLQALCLIIFRGNVQLENTSITLTVMIIEPVIPGHIDKNLLEEGCYRHLAVGSVGCLPNHS